LVVTHPIASENCGDRRYGYLTIRAKPTTDDGGFDVARLLASQDGGDLSEHGIRRCESRNRKSGRFTIKTHLTCCGVRG
jgi:hypothetical protein